MSPREIDRRRQEKGHREPDQRAKDQRPQDEGRAEHEPHPFVDDHLAQEQEDDAIRHRGQGLDRVFDRGVGLFGGVDEGVAFLDDSAGDQRDDSGPVEQFRPDVGQISRAEDDQRLQHSRVPGQSQGQRGANADQGSHEDAPEDHGEEGEKGQCVLIRLGVVLETQGAHRVVQDHGDAVVEEGFAKDQEIKAHVHADLFEDGQHGHGVNRGDHGREHQHLHYRRHRLIIISPASLSHILLNTQGPHYNEPG